MLILFSLILTLWFWSDLGARCVGTFYTSAGEKITKEMSILSALTCVYQLLPLLRTSARQHAHFHFLDTNSLILIGFWCALCWYFLRFRRWENQKEILFLSARTCVHHPITVSRTSAHRNALFRFLDTNSLILVWFGRALYWYFLRFSWWENSKINVLFVCTHMHTPPHSCFTYLRYATHWLIVFGMWISGGYQRIIRHDYRM